MHSFTFRCYASFTVSKKDINTDKVPKLLLHAYCLNIKVCHFNRVHIFDADGTIYVLNISQYPPGTPAKKMYAAIKSKYIL